MAADDHDEDDDSEQFRSGSEASEHTAKKSTRSKKSGSLMKIVILFIVGFSLIGYGLYKVTGNSSSSSGCGQKGQPCSAKEIAKHNKQTDCWVIYDGYYYNVTAWVTQHPGSADAFNENTCGHDINEYLNGLKDNDGLQHKHTQKAFQQLATYKIGPVQ